MERNPMQLLFVDEQVNADESYALSQRRQCDAERNLLVAVLKDALLSYKNNLVPGGARFKEAERWIFGEDTNRLFAFETVCVILDLSAQRIRRDLVSFAAAKLCGVNRHPHPSRLGHP